MKKRLKILLTNDDGYSSSGIKYMYEALSVRHEVVVAAPAEEQSGIGHAFTFKKPLHYFPIPETVGMPGFAISGTPSEFRHLGILLGYGCCGTGGRFLAASKLRVLSLQGRQGILLRIRKVGARHRRVHHVGCPYFAKKRKQRRCYVL
jgi:hypothetical protein